MEPIAVLGRTAGTQKNAERQFDDFAAAYRDKYTIKHVERDPTFLPISRFFAHYRPIRKPFAIFHCSLDLPLHTVSRSRTTTT